MAAIGYKGAWPSRHRPTAQCCARSRFAPSRAEEARYQAQMAAHHCLGALPKIGETLWYVATWRGQWLAQISLSAAAFKCGVRDAWIGWDFRVQFDRLKLIANNSRLLVLPEVRYPNVGSRVLALVAYRRYTTGLSSSGTGCG